MLTTVQEVRRYIEEADQVLIGIGERFDDKELLEQNKEYHKVSSQIRENQVEWVMPYVNTNFLNRERSEVIEAYRHLKTFLEDKEYFIVSVATNGLLQQADYPQERLVEPCGGFHLLQCSRGCSETLEETGSLLLEEIDQCCEGKRGWNDISAGSCTKCGGEKVFNSLYAQNYNEDGYLEQWENYTQWIQNILHRNICILELGVGMQYPSVIRWPFEKIAFFQEKAKMVRVHEKLFHLTEELSGKSYSLPMNAIELLKAL